MKKIRSRKGASITFALLAFLVCSVVSAVVLAAAAASAGRVSNLAEMDQRYYAVTSAAQLFRDTLDNQEFTIERSEIVTKYDFETYEKKANGTVAPADALVIPDSLAVEELQTSDYKLKMTAAAPGAAARTILDVQTADEEPADPPEPGGEEPLAPEEEADDPIEAAANVSFLANAALTCVIGNAGTADAAYVPAFGASIDEDDGLVRTMKLTFSNPGVDATDKTDYSILDVKAESTLRNDGSIVVKFSNIADAGKVFEIEMILAASVRDNSNTPTVTKTESVLVAETGENTGVFTERTETVTTTTKTTVISWVVTDVRKVSDE